MKCDPCGNILEYKNQSKSHIVKEHPKVWWMLKHVKVKGMIENTVRLRIEASPDWVWMEDSESCRRRWLSASVDSNWSRVDSRRPESRMLSAELGASLKRYITFHLKTGYIQNIFFTGFIPGTTIFSLWSQTFANLHQSEEPTMAGGRWMPLLLLVYSDCDNVRYWFIMIW